MQVLNSVECQGLLTALDDEYRAWAVYDQVICDFGEVRPFINIRDAEQRHIDALLRLCADYRVEAPANPWPGQVPRYSSAHEACQQAVTGEIENGALYDQVMQSTDRADLLRVYRALQNASIDRHLPAFRRCAARG